jgi:hypothetical protein
LLITFCILRKVYRIERLERIPVRVYS